MTAIASIGALGIIYLQYQKQKESVGIQKELAAVQKELSQLQINSLKPKQA